MMKNFLSLVIPICLVFSFGAAAQIPSDGVIDNSELPNYLKQEVKAKLATSGEITEASLAAYFRDEFSERYFYDWQNFEARFNEYNQLYDKKSEHQARAYDHMQKFADSTYWLLPFNYLNGDPVNAYALRHLARSHKMIDIAFQYYYDNKDPKYIQYFVNQMGSLNAALAVGAYEKIEDGNGVYEVFRSGYRILNWLRVHNMFLGQEAYTDKDQLTLIATMLQHGQDLYERNGDFRSGNHQTRGMSALALLSIIFRDFEGTDLWYDRAMEKLEEHLNKEINADGFQFERSVHYHLSDIGNYFYVYQLAQINNYEVSTAWEDRLKSLFVTLTQIAYPDKTAPVLQDDTDNPWAEKNDISGALTLGYLLFNDPSYGYFANSHVESTMFWFLRSEQLKMLEKIESQAPEFASLSFEETGYYIIREGWSPSSKMLIATAGLDDKKPDHQHGDMLGIQAMANGNVLLPNYQVRYSLKDYEFFKNSMVKNVALVDDELQGKLYRGNKGGSGFGKFGELPNPEVIAWLPKAGNETFIGAHDGFRNVGVSYTRQVINVNHDFWIVKDNFSSDKMHSYKQVWQGHYTITDNKNLLRATFADGTGFDILQLKDIGNNQSDGTQGKEWTIVSIDEKKNHSFITILYPYNSYDKRLDDSESNNQIGAWKTSDLSFEVSGVNSSYLQNAQDAYLFEVDGIKTDDISITLSVPSDFLVVTKEGSVKLDCIGAEALQLDFKTKKKAYLNGQRVKKTCSVKAGDVLEFRE